MYQLHIIWCSTIIAFALWRVKALMYASSINSDVPTKKSKWIVKQKCKRIACTLHKLVFKCSLGMCEGQVAHNESQLLSRAASAVVMRWRGSLDHCNAFIVVKFVELTLSQLSVVNGRRRPAVNCRCTWQLYSTYPSCIRLYYSPQQLAAAFTTSNEHVYTTSWQATYVGVAFRGRHDTQPSSGRNE